MVSRQVPWIHSNCRAGGSHPAGNRQPGRARGPHYRIRHRARFFRPCDGGNEPGREALIASADSFGGPGILATSQNGGLFRWRLANGLRVSQPLTRMSVGLYNEPAGAWLPSILLIEELFATHMNSLTPLLGGFLRRHPEGHVAPQRAAGCYYLDLPNARTEG